MANNDNAGGTGGNPIKAAIESPKEYLEGAQKTLSEAGEGAKAEIGRLAEKATGHLHDTAGDLKEKAQSMAAQQKELLAEHLGSFTQALEKVAAELKSGNVSSAGYVGSISNSLNQVTRNIAEKDVGELWSMAQSFGQRQPTAFMGVAAILGFAASRFLIASETRQSGSSKGQTGRSEGGAARSDATARPPVSGEFARHIAMEPGHDGADSQGGR